MSQGLTERIRGRLRAELATRRLSARELAKQMDVSELWTQRRIYGTTKISTDDLEQLAEALDVPVARLVPTEADAA